MQTRLTITQSKVAAAFASTRSRSILFALMRADLSLGQLASMLGMSLSLLRYHVLRLQALGLVELVNTKERAGRPIKIYRAAAREFRVPISISNQRPGVTLRRELDEALERAEARDPQSITYFVDEHGRPKMQRSKRCRTVEQERWWRLRLTPSDAAKLNSEIAELLRSYEQSDEASGEALLCHFAMVRR